jgi:hypothetical protein
VVEAIMKQNSFASISVKTTVVHTVTYFIVGAISFLLLDYSARYADPVVSRLMRQTDHPLVAAGTMFQLLRGFLFGIVFYLLRDLVFPKKYGWLTMWLVLVIVGILSPFAAAPSSIEGMLYTVLPLWFHISNFPEILVQSGVLAWLTYYWVNHPEKKWLNWVLGIILVIVLLFSVLGALSAWGVLPSAG